MLKKLETPRQCEVQSAEARCQNTAHWQFWFQAVCDQCIEQSASMGGPYGQQFAEALDDIHRRKLAPVIPYEVGDEPLHTAENDYQCDDPTCPCNQPEGRIARLIEESVRNEILRADTSGLSLL